MPNPRIQDAVSTEDAVDMLDTRIPLTAREIRQVCQSLYDAARRDGVEYATGVLRRAAAGVEENGDRENQRLAGLLLHLADALDKPAEEVTEARAEYLDPTQAIREQLTEKARKRDDKKARQQWRDITEEGN